MNENTVTLFISLRSPFARRVRLALRRLKRAHQEVTLDVFQDNPELNRYNPMGAVPTLKLKDGTILTDSMNILDFLGCLSGDYRERQAVVIAEGLMQSVVLYFQEKVLHEAPSPRWLNEHLTCMRDTLAYVAASPMHLWFEDGELTQAGWDLAVGIEYMELRVPEITWKSDFPNLETILLKARENADFLVTTPPA